VTERVVGGFLLIALVVAICPVAAEVTVIDVMQGGVGGQSGVESGDRILAIGTVDGSWTQIEHPLDVEAMAFGPGRIGPLRLRLDSDQGLREVELPVGDLGLVVGPGDGTLALRAEDEFDAVLSEAGLGEALSAWKAFFDSRSDNPRTRCWARLRTIGLLVDRGEIDRATTEAGLLDSACEAAPMIDSVLARAAAAQALRERARDTDAVAALLESASLAARALDPIVRAALAHDLGSFLGRRGRLDVAEVALDRAVAEFQDAAPVSWGYADSLTNRALIDAIRGRLEAARQRLESALRLMERIAPDSLAMSMQQANLSIVMRGLGEPDQARILAESALAIRQRLVPGSELVAQTLNNLGVLAKNRGDLVAAEGYYEQALRLRETLNSPPLARASVLGNLANLALERLDPETSLVLHRQVLALLEPVVPGHRLVAVTHLSLGQGALLRGRFDEAESHLNTARSLQEAIGTDAPVYASILEALARLARERQQTSTARSLLEQALALRQQIDPAGLDEASVALALAEMDLAEGLESRIYERLRSVADRAAARAPGSLVEARALHALAGLLWGRGDQQAALHADQAAIDAFERQRERLGGDWLQRMRFGASHRQIYIDAIERQLETGGTEQAFTLQERYRAYERRRLLAGRVPLPSLDPAPTRVDELATRMAPDEAILSWVAGPQSTHAFLLTASGLVARSLPWGDAAWRDEVDALAVLLNVARPTPAQAQVLTDRLTRLHERLIGPWQDALAPIRRLVLVPDQVLHRLPFAALQEASTERFLIERFALVYSASSLLYLTGPASGAESGTVVAVGDPTLSEATDPEAVPSIAAVERRPDMVKAALPAARAEVEAIAGFFPERTLRLIGAAATETRVRQALPAAGMLHLAAHAVVDGARPLDAYVQLAPDGQAGDDGRLAAWEVLSELQFDAELVTLSACSTARGRTLGGDGVLGLSQAFQLAGARAVLATLWDVPDRPTAELMTVFYRGLAEGRDPASALRTAQIDSLARVQDHRHPGFWRRIGQWLRGESGGQVSPFEWAAFKLEGRIQP